MLLSIEDLLHCVVHIVAIDLVNLVCLGRQHGSQSLLYHTAGYLVQAFPQRPRDCRVGNLQKVFNRGSTGRAVIELGFVRKNHA